MAALNPPKDKEPRVPILAHLGGIRLMCQLLIFQGAMCPKCGFGTRVTSKRWAKCKKCGERVERRSLPARKAKSVPRGSKSSTATGVSFK